MSCANLDSFVFRIKIEEMERIRNCQIITIKHGIIRPDQELQEYYKSVTRKNYQKVKRATSIFLIEHSRGQCFSVIQWCNSGYVDIAAIGLQKYAVDGSLDDGAIQRREMLFEVLHDLCLFRVVRVDYAIDMPEIPTKIVEKICGKRKLNPWLNSNYYQSDKQRVAENPYLKIFIYNKALKDSLPFPRMRLELALKVKHWPNTLIGIDQLDDLLTSKGEKVIKQWTGENVKFNPFFSAYLRTRVSTTEKCL